MLVAPIEKYGHRFLYFIDINNAPKQVRNYSNAEYFVINLNENYTTLTKGYGGYLGQLTYSFINEKGLDVDNILVAAVPAEHTEFNILYVYRKGEVVKEHQIALNTFPAEYGFIKDKFVDSVSKQGITFDLLNDPEISPLLKDFMCDYKDTGVTVDGKILDIPELDQDLYTTDFSWIKPEAKIMQCNPVKIVFTKYRNLKYELQFVGVDGNIISEADYFGVTVDEEDKESIEMANTPFSDVIDLQVMRCLKDLHFVET